MEKTFPRLSVNMHQKNENIRRDAIQRNPKQNVFFFASQTTHQRENEVSLMPEQRTNTHERGEKKMQLIIKLSIGYIMENSCITMIFLFHNAAMCRYCFIHYSLLFPFYLN